MRALCALLVLGVLLGAGHAAREYRIVTGHDIPGNDIPSGGQPYTKVCVPAGGYKGKYGYDAFKLLCDENPKCVAFTAPARPDGCAYLKSKGRRDVIKANKDFVAVTSAEPPQKACKFAALGESCSSDPWADQPVCCGGNKNPCVNGVCVSGYPSNPGPAKTPANSPRQYRFIYKMDIAGNDIPSGGQAFTKVCAPANGYKGKIGYDALGLYCDENPKCVAVAVVTAEPGCGYLKTKGTRDVIKPSEKFSVLTSQEPQQKACKFSAFGEACTTDPWVDQPLCCGGNHSKCVNGKCESTFPSGR